MALVMGVDPRDETTLDRASDLGIAFQLANIARDVAEDAAADRCYLPVEWMVELDIPPGQHMHPAFRGRLSVMAKWLSEMAEDYEASGRWGARSEEHTSELQSLMRISYAVFCLKTKQTR